MSNSIGEKFRVTSFGASHGKAVGAIVDGCPANLELSAEDIQKELNKRKPGTSSVTTPRKEDDEVQILSKVELKNIENGMKLAYTIVSEGEANLRENKISIKTPIAQGLLGKKVGDVAEVTVPRGVMKFEIMNICFG